MGMTKEQFTLIVKGINAVYPDTIKDKTAFDVWYELLKDLDYEMASVATQQYMRTGHFPPKPADIRNTIADMTTIVSDEPTEQEAWGMVRKALNNSLYNADTEYAKLPELIRKTVGSPSQLRAWAMEPDVETVIASNFMRSYRARQSREHEIRKMPKDVLQLVNRTVQMLEAKE